jgi:hypothetical protein
MAILVSESEAMQSLPQLLDQAQRQAVIIRDGKTDLGVIVSMKDYATIQRIKGQRALDAMNALGAELRGCATRDGITLEELEAQLERKAPAAGL